MTQNSYCRFIKRSNWRRRPKPRCWEGCVQPEVLEIICQRYDLRHIVDLIDVDLDLDLYRQVMHDLAVTKYRDHERSVVLLHDTDYCETISAHGHTVYNFFKLAAAFDVPLDRVIFITNHHGLGAQIQYLSRTVCNSEPPQVIETVLWYDFPQSAQLDRPDSDVTYRGSHLYVCPNNKLRRHRVFLLCCLANRDLLSRGAVSYHFGPCI
jgi:hypothetical protein